MNRDIPKKLKYKRKKKMLILMIIALLIAMWAYSNFRVVTTEYTISSDKIPESFDGYTIVQISDVHGRQYGDDNSILVGMVREQTPDIIAITGDFIDRRPNLERAKTLVSQLVEIAPVYYVSGNHEWDSGKQYELFAILDGLGVKIMYDESVLLTRGEDSIVLAGVQDPNSWEIRQSPTELMDAVTETYPEKYRILLMHRNNAAKKYPDLQTDLVICGHAHGGIIRLPYFGGVLGVDRNLFPDDEDSVIGQGNYDIVVSHGLGENLFRARFLNPPEIVVVKLSSK